MDKIDLALSEAIKAIYLGDDSDFEETLWEIVFILGGEEASDLLAEDETAAYNKYCKEQE